MKAIVYFLLEVVLFIFFLLVTSPIMAALIWFFNYIDADEELKSFKSFAQIAALTYLLGVPWLTHQIAKRMAFEDQKFVTAVKSTLYDVRLRLAFIPVLGRWFQPDSNEKESDDGRS